jgi:hypothetical protein
MSGYMRRERSTGCGRVGTSGSSNVPVVAGVPSLTALSPMMPLINDIAKAQGQVGHVGQVISSAAIVSRARSTSSHWRLDHRKSAWFFYLPHGSWSYSLAEDRCAYVFRRFWRM